MKNISINSIIRKGTKRKIETVSRKTVLEFIQSLTLSPTELADLLNIKEREAKRILNYEKFPTDEQLTKIKEHVNEIL